ncbi:MAG TPA: hypothetical protein VFW56_14950, partial [Bradyrhizobium sp.]|nr:hypothetical protein [Bradyrhizobium sp.]
NGATWSDPVQVNSTSDVGSQFLPSIALDESSGTLALGWYSASGDPGDVKSQFVIAASEDGGATFSPVTVASLGSSDATDPKLDDSGQFNQFGDYTGIAFVGGIAAAALADNSAELGSIPDRPNFDIAEARLGIAQVADAPLTDGQALDVSPQEGENFNEKVASFKDSDPGAKASDYSVTIDWGDDNKSSSKDGSITVEANSAGGFDITASHAYDEEGSFDAVITVLDRAGASIKVTNTIEVDDGQLTAAGVDFKPLESQDYRGVVATFTDEDPDGAVPDYTARIDWGDGTISDGVITTAGSASLAYDPSGTIYAIGNLNDQADPNNPDNGTPYLFSANAFQSGGPIFTPVMKLGSGFNGGLAFVQNSSVQVGTNGAELFAIRNDDAGTSSLYQINLQTFDGGAPVPGGSTLTHLFDIGHGFTGGLAIDSTNGGFYAIARDDIGASTLERIDVNGAVTAVAALGNTIFSGLTYTGAGFTAIGSDADGLSSLYRITPDGTASLDLPLGQGFSGGVAFVPNSFTLEYFAIQGGGDGSATFYDIIPALGSVVATGAVGVQFTDGFNVLGGPHSYGAAGQSSVSVLIKDHGGSFITAASSATVVDPPPVVLSSATITDGVFPGIQTGSLTLASFTVPGGLETGPADYSATINWGDGTSDPGTLTISGDTIAVSGQHIYGFTTSGILHPTVTLNDDTGGSATANDTVFVAPDVSGEMSEIGTAPIFNPATGLFYADLTVTNDSTAPITGPLYVMLQGLPTAVTLTSFTQTDSRGDPWQKFDQSSLAAGNSLADIQLVFADPNGVPISYTTKVFDGMAADPALAFEPNVGQADSSVSFIAHGPGFEVGLAGDHTALLLAGSGQSAGAAALMSWVGGNPSPQAIPLDLQPGVSNYLLGNQSIDGVAHYGRVMFASVYDGIDLTYYGHAGQLEFDWTVNPGADPSAIAMRFDGVESMRIDDAGNLHLATAAGDLMERAPIAYQMIGGQRENVSASFEMRPDGTVGFAVGAHDASAALVIDPVLEFATYLGGSDPYSNPYLFNTPDVASAVAVDAQGNSYVAGYTYSPDFPTVNALQTQPTAAFTSDAFVTKFAPDGTVLFSTYLGGGIGAPAFPFGPPNNGFGTQARAIAVDAAGDIFIAGSTDAQSFPLLNPVVSAGAEGFLTEFASDGGSLKFSSRLPGFEAPNAIAVDALGNVYGTGGGLDFNSGASGFVWKIDPAAAMIDYSVSLADAEGASIAVDAHGQAYIAGTADSAFQTVNALLPTSSEGSLAAFVAKLTDDGSILFSTYLTTGPSFSEANATGIALGPAGEIEVVGDTQSSDLLVANGLQTARQGLEDGFLIKLTNDGSEALYGTYIGGNVTVNGVAVDAQGRTYLTGEGFEYAGPPVLPTINAFQPTFQPDFYAPSSGFAGALAADGSGFDYLTWGIGANAMAVAVDPSGDATFLGEQGGAADLTSPGEFDIPTTPGAFQPLPAGGGSNIFVVRILPGDTGTVTLRNVPVQAVEGQPFTDTVVAAFTTTGSETASQFTASIDWGDGTSSPGKIVGDFQSGFRVLGSHVYDMPGTSALAVTLYDSQGRPVGVSSSDAAAAASGSVHYHVSLDTSAFAGTDGQLAIQFNPGAIPGAPNAQALISHL